MDSPNKLQFKATVSRIVKFEETVGKSLQEAFDGGGLSTLRELIKACTDASNEQIDAYVEEFGFDALIEELMKAMVKSGFLPKSALEAMKTKK